MTTSNNLTVTLIQSDIEWENKSKNLEKFQEKISTIEVDTDLIILPEMFSTGFSIKPNELAETMTGESVMWMINIAKEKQTHVCGSLIIKENQNYYNRLIFVSPDGTTTHYDKKHLFSYAGEDKHYTPGNKRAIVDVNGWRINLQICYDLRFPAFVRNQDDYDVILYVANWPVNRRLAWNTLLQARAIENQAYVIGVNRIGSDPKNSYGGDSSIINPIGETIYQKKLYSDVKTIGLSKHFLDKTRDNFPFLKDRDKILVN